MALTATQKAEVRRYLGYPDLSQGAYSTLEGAMSAISAEAELQVAAYLTDLLDIEARLRSSWGVQVAKKAEEVELWGWAGIMALRQEGNRLVEALGRLLNTEPQRQFFTSAGGSGGSSGFAGRG